MLSLSVNFEKGMAFLLSYYITTYFGSLALTTYYLGASNGGGSFYYGISALNISYMLFYISIGFSSSSCLGKLKVRVWFSEDLFSAQVFDQVDAQHFS